MMELYILDGLYRRVQVVDKFESLIWTERWQEVGDFELHIQSTYANRSKFTIDTFLGMSESDRMMRVETLEDTVEDGEEVLIVSGRSAEFVLQNRVLKESPLSGGDWHIDKTPIEFPRFLFKHVVEDLAIHSSDGIPLLTQRYPASDIPPEESDVRTFVITGPKVLYDEIKKACERYDLGFRIVLDHDDPQLYFEIYSGRDVTTKQTQYNAVVFSSGFDNLANPTEFSSVKGMKQIAFTFVEEASGTLYGLNYDNGGHPQDTGFDRRVALVVVDSIPENWVDPPGWYLDDVGFDALRRQRSVAMFDGVMNKDMAYQYGDDYMLGDLIEMRNRDGVVTYKHVTEQIFVSDINGERSYPTLSVGRFEPPNTWLSYSNDVKAWADMTTEYWEDM